MRRHYLITLQMYLLPPCGGSALLGLAETIAAAQFRGCSPFRAALLADYVTFSATRAVVIPRFLQMQPSSAEFEDCTRRASTSQNTLRPGFFCRCEGGDG